MIFTALLFPFFFISCGGDNGQTEDMCITSQFQLELVHVEGAVCGTNMGALEVNASGSQGFMYSLDAVNFQVSGAFDGVKPGQYIVKVVDENGCFETLEVVVPSSIRFSEAIMPIITENCAISGCHVAGEQAPDLSIRENIFSAAPRIKSQVETGAMPFGAERTLTETEIESIICWFSDGAKDN